MYSFFLLRYLFNKKKLLLSGIKIYTCGVLYLIIRNMSSTYYDIATPFIFYSFGMLAHGVLIHQLRDYEEQYLFFYRSLSVPLPKRLLNYILLCGLLLLPEAATIAFMSPSHLLLPDAILFVVSGYAIVLLLSGILFYYACTMLDYLRLSFVILCFIYLLLIMHLFYWLPLLCTGLSLILFIRGYYSYEKKNTGNIGTNF